MEAFIEAAKRIYFAIKAWLTRYLANGDPFAASANTGAFIVWSNQPFYPLYVAWIVGSDAWPSLLTWLSTPFFVAVPVLARRNSLKGRSLFVVAGVSNTLLAAKAFGTASAVAWFLLPCLVIAVAFFHQREWPAILALTALTGIGVLAVPHLGAPFHIYTPDQSWSLAKLNIYSVSALTLYLVIAAIRLPRSSGRDVEIP